MVKTIKLRDRTFPGQRLEKLKYRLSHGNALPNADVTLHCGITGKSLKAHKLVLASISERLRSYLAEYEKEGNGMDDSGIHLIIDDIEWDVLKIIIDFAYTGETKVATSIVDCICEAAHRLEIKYLKDSFVKMNRKYVS